MILPDQQYIGVKLGARRMERFILDSEIAHRARQIAVHPLSEIEEVRSDAMPFFGPMGATRYVIVLRVDNRFEKEVHADTSHGGPGDRLIANVARKLTGESEPAAVANALGRHFVRQASDLWHALRLSPGDSIMNALRAEIAKAFGLVEPTLPEWVREGAKVRAPWGQCIVTAVSDAGVSVDGCEPIPAGVFLTTWVSDDACHSEPSDC